MFKHSQTCSADAISEPHKFQIWEPGDRVGQLIIIPYPRVIPIEVQNLKESDRGTGGFGSTGN